MKVICARAPSNIALIKYMGKKNSLNVPENSSISMTLNALSTVVEVRQVSPEGSQIQWVPELPVGLDARVWSHPGLKNQDRVLNHFTRVCKLLPHIVSASEMSGLGTYELRSANNFPPSSGIASSASAFAAMTLGMAGVLVRDSEQFARRYQQDIQFVRALAEISRQGSGSSCRSFEGPWVLWQEENAQGIEHQMPKMAHFVILVQTSPKDVGSSEAHLRVKSSPLWSGRNERAEQRVQLSQKALKLGDISAVSRLAWQDAWEMHSLFHTSEDPFTYWTGGSIDVLRWVQPFLKDSLPPIVTMDAGPNVHISVVESQVESWRQRLREQFPAFQILEDTQGVGATLDLASLT